MTRTRKERETVVRWDDTEELAYLWTASSTQVRRRQRLGFPVAIKLGGWVARAPKQAIVF